MVSHEMRPGEIGLGHRSIGRVGGRDAGLHRRGPLAVARPGDLPEEPQGRPVERRDGDDPAEGALAAGAAGAGARSPSGPALLDGPGPARSDRSAPPAPGGAERGLLAALAAAPQPDRLCRRQAARPRPGGRSTGGSTRSIASTGRRSWTSSPITPASMSRRKRMPGYPVASSTMPAMITAAQNRRCLSRPSPSSSAPSRTVIRTLSSRAGAT